MILSRLENPQYRRRADQFPSTSKCSGPSQSVPFPVITSAAAPVPVSLIYHFISWGLSPLRRLKDEAR